MSIKEQLANIPISDFPLTPKNGGKIITVQHDATVLEALDILSANKIYSAPVWHSNEQQYIGLIDVIDIVEFIASNFDETAILTVDRAIFEQNERFKTTKVVEVVGLSQQDPLVPVPSNEKLLLVIKLLSDRQVHRVAVWDNQEITNIITQSGVLERLNATHLGDFGKSTIAELNLGSQPVYTVDITDKTINAFRLLRNKKLYAVAVVQRPSGVIVSTISAKDVRTLCDSHFSLLYAPISQFLAAVHAAEIDIRNPSIVCKDTDSLATVIEKLSLNKIHRIYVLDDNSRPAKVITLTDIMSILCN